MTAQCPWDSDGDGTCRRHPNGCPTPEQVAGDIRRVVSRLNEYIADAGSIGVEVRVEAVSGQNVPSGLPSGTIHVPHYAATITRAL